MTGTEALSTLGIVVGAVSPFAVALWVTINGRLKRLEVVLEEVRKNGFNPAVCREIVGGVRGDLGRVESGLKSLTNGGQIAQLTERITRLEERLPAPKPPTRRRTSR